MILRYMILKPFTWNIQCQTYPNIGNPPTQATNHKQRSCIIHIIFPGVCAFSSKEKKAIKIIIHLRQHCALEEEYFWISPSLTIMHLSASYTPGSMTCTHKHRHAHSTYKHLYCTLIWAVTWYVIMYCEPCIRQQTIPEGSCFHKKCEFCSHESVIIVLVRIMSVCVHSLRHSHKNSVLVNIQECLFSTCEAETCVLLSQKYSKMMSIYSRGIPSQTSRFSFCK
jgi:hypothetical protein